MGWYTSYNPAMKPARRLGWRTVSLQYTKEKITLELLEEDLESGSKRRSVEALVSVDRLRTETGEPGMKSVVRMKRGMKETGQRGVP